MRITVDTNVLISATFWLGDSHKIIELAEQKKIDLILSEAIIEEYRDVLIYAEIQEKAKNKNLAMQWSVQKIFSLSKIVIPQRKVFVVHDDPDDNAILECALAGNVDYLITQDHHLLRLKAFEAIKILTPREFLQLLS